MAKLKIFTVKDHKVGIFMRPFFELHVGSALRSWEEACRSSESPFNKFPNDFSLFLVGEFDDLTGELRQLDSPEHMSAARDHVEPRQTEMKLATN